MLVWYNVLWLRLLRPLLESLTLGIEGAALWLYAVPVGLGLCLWITGLVFLRRPPVPDNALVQWMRLLAILPAGLLAGVGVGVGMAGAWQGTLLPQFWRAAALGGSPPGETGWLVGVLTLLITTGVLLYLQTGERKNSNLALPRFGQGLILAWGWIGQRALWLAAGFLFARLFASRITLLIARLDALTVDLYTSSFWIWLQSLWGGPT